MYDLPNIAADAFESIASDPIADMRRSIERIKRQTSSPPIPIYLPANLPEQYLRTWKEQLELARQVLGVGVDLQGRVRCDGILWSVRGGRRSKMRRRYLRELETLPARIVGLEGVPKEKRFDYLFNGSAKANP